MRADKLIAKMGPKVQVITDTGGGFGALTDKEIAHAMVGLQKRYYLAARTAWLHDKQSFLELQGEILIALKRLSGRERWRLPNKPILQQISHLIAVELYKPPLCKTCQGHGILYSKQGVVSECQTCNGACRGRLSERYKAKYTEVDWRTWRRTWGNRYDMAYNLIQDWLITAASHAKKRLQ